MTYDDGKQPKILIVDDTPANLDILSEMLKKRGYRVRPAPGGRIALQGAKIDPPDLILLDINMPDMNGYEVCLNLKKTDVLKDIPVIFISALNETFDKIKAFSIGGVDYITKPFQFEEVLARVSAHLRLYLAQKKLEYYNKNLKEIVQEKIREIHRSEQATIFALAKLAESRDNDTGSHLERVQLLCKMIAEQIFLKNLYRNEVDPEFIENIYRASPLHDIGKVGIVDRVLLKPGKLTPEEFEYMKSHVEIGADTLEAVQKNNPENAFIAMGIEITRYHHERWDGAGYNRGLKGIGIPLCARIMAVVDVYDAIRSQRCYKPARDHDETCREILRGRDSQFDPEIVDLFMEIAPEVQKVWKSHSNQEE